MKVMKWISIVVMVGFFGVFIYGFGHPTLGWFKAYGVILFASAFFPSAGFLFNDEGAEKHAEHFVPPVQTDQILRPNLNSGKDRAAI